MIRIGDKVKCIKPLKKENALIAKPLPEGIYTVRQVRNVCVTGEEGVLLEEIHNDINPIIGIEMGYKLSRFEKINQPC
jgi:hypothetical protein